MATAQRGAGQPSAPRGSGRSLRCLSGPAGEECADPSLIQDIVLSDIRLGGRDAPLRFGIAQELRGRLDALKIPGRQQHQVFAPVFRDADPFVRDGDRLGDLRQESLDLRVYFRLP